MEEVWFDGDKLNNLLKVLNIQGLGIPAVKSQKLQIAGKSGSFYDKSLLQERVVTIECFMDESFSFHGNTIEQKIDNLKRIVSPFKGECELKFGRHLDRVLFARYEGIMDIEQIIKTRRFPLTFVASDPLFYDDNPISLSGGNGKYNVNLNGNVPSKWLKITGAPGSMMSVSTSTDSGISLKMPQDVPVASNIMVDCYNGYINNGANGGGGAFYQSGHFLTLPADGDFVYVSGFAGDVNIMARSAYL